MTGDVSLWLVLAVSVAISAATTATSVASATFRAEVERQARAGEIEYKRLGYIVMLLSALITAAWVWHAVATGNWLYGAVGLLPWAIGTIQAVRKIVWARKARREKGPIVVVHCEPLPGETEAQTAERVRSAIRLDDLMGHPR